MSNMLLGFICGVLLFCVIQLCSIEYKLDGIWERLYGTKMRRNRRGKDLPDGEEDNDDWPEHDLNH